MKPTKNISPLLLREQFKPKSKIWSIIKVMATGRNIRRLIGATAAIAVLCFYFTLVDPQFEFSPKEIEHFRWWEKLFIHIYMGKIFYVDAGIISSGIAFTLCASLFLKKGPDGTWIKTDPLVDIVCVCWGYLLLFHCVFFILGSLLALSVPF